VDGAGVAVRTLVFALVVVLVSVAALAVMAGVARADVCGAPTDANGGPLAGGTDVADFGAIPETCPGTDVSLRLRTTVLVASSMPDYYGALALGSTVRLRQRLGGPTGRTWLTFAADVLTYRYVVNAVVKSHDFSFGPPTLGLHRTLVEGEWTAVSVYGRMLLPLDTARGSGVRLGFELGATARRLLGAQRRGGIQGGVALLGPLDVVAGQTHATLQPVGLVEGWFAPAPRFALFAGAEGRAEITPDPALLTVAPRIAARLSLRHALSLAALIEMPIVGTDRTDFVGAVTLGWHEAQGDGNGPER
jgi:hypothetical protein